MSLLRSRKPRQPIDEPRMRLDWQQRAMIVGVPKSARDLFGQLEARAASDPEYLEPVAEIVRQGQSHSAMATFGLFHTPEHNVMGVVVVVGDEALTLLNANDGHPYAKFSWPTLCRFDVKHDRNYQIVGLAWYDGEPDIAQRIVEETPLLPAEMRFAYMYMHADKEVLTAINVAFDRAAVPEEMHRRPPLL